MTKKKSENDFTEKEKFSKNLTFFEFFIDKSKRILYNVSVKSHLSMLDSIDPFRIKDEEEERKCRILCCMCRF